MTKKIGYSKTYPILSIGVWEKIWIEEEVPIETDTRKCLYELKKQVENFHYESNKADEKKAEVKKLDEDVLYKMSNPIQYDLREEIKSCQEIKVLEGYRLIVKGKPELETAYNNRLKELT